MTEVSDCSVCTEKFTNSVRIKICCGYCSYNACKTCVTRYLLSQVVDAHCMNCRTGWNRDFLDINLSKAFVKGSWRDHKKKMYLNREKAILPNFQIFAAAKKQMNLLKPCVDKAYKELCHASMDKEVLISNIYSSNNNIADKNIQSTDEIYVNHLTNISKLQDVVNKYSECFINHRKLNNNYFDQIDIYEGKKKKVEKKEFIMKCVKDDCRGFLSQAYKCELCSTYVCKDCMTVKNEKNDNTHICNKDDVDTVTLIRKETVPCPRCGIRISKIDGCDMMWCTAPDCGTAFSWMSGKILTGIIHNPHYYEWQRRNNNGVAPRNPGDVLCDGFPEYNTVIAVLRRLGIHNNHTTLNPFSNSILDIYNIHRCFMDIQGYRIPLYTTTRSPMIFKEYHVDYLIGNITEDKWIKSIFMKELNIEKKDAILTVLQTFLRAGQDLFISLMNILNILDVDKNLNPKYIITPENFKPIYDLLVQFKNLRKYINETLITTGEAVNTPVPQFNKIWYWEPIASVENVKERIILAKKNMKDKKDKKDKENTKKESKENVVNV